MSKYECTSALKKYSKYALKNARTLFLIKLYKHLTASDNILL